MDCEFCTVRGKPRCAPPERLLRQISFLLETKDARHFFIVDDLFGQQRDETIRFCNMLKDYQKHIKEFKELNASIMAVSVDKPEKITEWLTENQMDIEIISNPEADLLELYNAVYKVPDDLATMYKEKYNIDLEAASGRTDHVISVPATYVIDEEGTIIFAHSDEDYKIRKSAEEILEVLRGM